MNNLCCDGDELAFFRFTYVLFCYYVELCRQVCFACQWSAYVCVVHLVLFFVEFIFQAAVGLEGYFFFICTNLFFSMDCGWFS